MFICKKPIVFVSIPHTYNLLIIDIMEHPTFSIKKIEYLFYWSMISQILELKKWHIQNICHIYPSNHDFFLQ